MVTREGVDGLPTEAIAREATAGPVGAPLVPVGVEVDAEGRAAFVAELRRLDREGAVLVLPTGVVEWVG